MAAVVSNAAPDDTVPSGDRLSALRLPVAWLGVVPFFAYVTLFLLVPSAWLVFGAFRTDSGTWTLRYVRELFNPPYSDAYLTSIRLSVVTALAGGLFGMFVAYAAVKEGTPRWARSAFITFSGVAANFAGVPLAFAFVATLGTTGVVTLLLSRLGFNLAAHGFELFHFSGLALTYTYFQLPLMIVLISPALDGLRREWREAAVNLGASPTQFWRWVGVPVLLPSLLGAVVLLFGNAFSAYATAYALVGGGFNLVPIEIGSVISGEFASNAQLADALSLGMIAIIALTVVVYLMLTRRASRWQP